MSLLREIAAEVSSKHGLEPGELFHHDRAWRVSHPRQEFMWRARLLRRDDGKPRFSYPQIGAFLGVDHTTVIHGVRQHDRRLVPSLDGKCGPTAKSHLSTGQIVGQYIA